MKYVFVFGYVYLDDSSEQYSLNIIVDISVVVFIFHVVFNTLSLAFVCVDAFKLQIATGIKMYTMLWLYM